MRLLDGRLARLRPRSFRTQIVLTTMGLMALLVLGVGLVLQALLEATANREVSQVLDQRTAEVRRGLDRSGDRGLDGAELDPGEQVYDAEGRLVAGSVEARGRRVAAALGRTTRARTQEVGDDLVLRATPYQSPDGVRGTIVVSQVTTPYESSEHDAFLATIVLGVLAVAATGLVARQVTTQALRPVREMAARAAEWSETDLGHRFALGPPDNEITALGETLDHLLERVARAIHSEQRLTSELAHELRTPLAAVMGAADLALMRGIDDAAVRVEVEQIAASARTMAETITTLLDLARELGEGGSDDTCLAADLLAAARTHLREATASGLRLDAPDPGDDLGARRIGAPLAPCLRALAPLLDNAARFADHEVRLRLTHDPGQGRVSIRVGDDGPGFDPAVADRVFAPGASGTGSTGLGLAIARRVARSLGGEIDLAPDGVVLSLPAA